MALRPCNNARVFTTTQNRPTSTFLHAPRKTRRIGLDTPPKLRPNTPMDPISTVLALPDITERPFARSIATTLCSITGTSSAGFPFLSAEAYKNFRDGVPHILAMGPIVLSTLDALTPALVEAATQVDGEHIARADRVVRQVVNTAAITAPPDLWLLRQVLGTYKQLGILDRMLAGEVIDPDNCTAIIPERGGDTPLDPVEVETDFILLRTRGYVTTAEGGFVITRHPEVRRVFETITPLPTDIPAGVAQIWRRLFEGNTLETHEVRMLTWLCKDVPARTAIEQKGWFATLEEIELGYRMVPIVLGLRVAGHTASLAAGHPVRAADLAPKHRTVAKAALHVLALTGTLDEDEGNCFHPTAIGRRVFGRGPGPFGIIEAYHTYMRNLKPILVAGREAVWVNRATNIAASQDANKKTFVDANDALDHFCKEHGFSYSVFVEHALGRGEATRQRAERSRDADLHFFGADLEDAAIDAAIAEREAGNLPTNMSFVRHADIGKPDSLFAAIRTNGDSTEGAIIMVGNGFHEVRNQSDAKMVALFRSYCEAGTLLIFTEANALSVSDLMATAWNSYHAGFMYVHAKSGQGLRPADPREPTSQRRPLPASWQECANLAGYVRLEEYSKRSRTAYPYAQPGRLNPAISCTHFYIPAALAEQLGINP